MWLMMSHNQGTESSTNFQISAVSHTESSGETLKSTVAGEVLSDVERPTFGGPKSAIRAPFSIHQTARSTKRVTFSLPQKPAATKIQEVVSSSRKDSDARPSDWLIENPPLVTSNPTCRPSFGCKKGRSDIPPAILEVLKYSRDSRYHSVLRHPAPRPGTVQLKPKKLGRENELTFHKCNECETEEGEYTFCDHEDDDGPYDTTVYFDRIRERFQTSISNLVEDDLFTVDSVEHALHPTQSSTRC